MKRIVGLKVGIPKNADRFRNVHFKAFRGHNSVIHEFTLADLPFLGPYDWILMFNIVVKGVAKYEPIYNQLRKLIRCYILEMEMMDVELPRC